MGVCLVYTKRRRVLEDMQREGGFGDMVVVVDGVWKISWVVSYVVMDIR